MHGSDQMLKVVVIRAPNAQRTIAETFKHPANLHIAHIAYGIHL